MTTATADGGLRNSVETPLAEIHIDEYLRDRLMPVEGTIPHLPGIEIYGNSIPAETAGGDLFSLSIFSSGTTSTHGSRVL